MSGSNCATGRAWARLLLGELEMSVFSKGLPLCLTDTFLSRNVIYIPRSTSLHFSQQCQDKDSVNKEADQKKRNSSTTGEYFLDIQNACNFSCKSLFRLVLCTKKKRQMTQTIHSEHAYHVCRLNIALSWDFLFSLYENSPFYLLKFFYLNNIYYSICSKSKKKLI